MTVTIENLPLFSLTELRFSQSHIVIRTKKLGLTKMLVCISSHGLLTVVVLRQLPRDHHEQKIV